MRARGRRAIACVALAVCAAGLQAAQGDTATFPARDVRVAVTVGTDATARVREEYPLTAPVDAAAFEFLDDPCSRVGPIASTIDGRAVALDVRLHAPWTTLRAAGVAAAAGSVWRLEYDVRTLGGDASVPLVVPAATLEPVADTRGAAIAIAVTGDGVPTLPRFDRGADGAWRARLLALPSVVRLRLPPAGSGACVEAVGGVTGGLEWRFWIFVATMAIWVPVYLWWFGRRRAGEDD